MLLKLFLLDIVKKNIKIIIFWTYKVITFTLYKSMSNIKILFYF